MDKQNRFRAQYAQMTSYVAVGLLWLATSVLSFFILTGAATTAAYRVTKMIANQEKAVAIFKHFLATLKSEGRIATGIYVFSLVLFTGLFLIYNFAVNTGQEWMVVFVLISAIELAVFNMYVYPLIAVFDHASLGALIKNTVLFAHRHLFTTFKLLGTFTLFIWLIVGVHPSFFILALSIYFWLSMVHLERVFAPYIRALQEGSHEQVS